MNLTDSSAASTGIPPDGGIPLDVAAPTSGVATGQSDPVGGTAPTPDELLQHRLDHEALQTLADDLAAHLRVTGTDPIAGSPRFQAGIIAVMERVAQACADIIVIDPPNPTHVGVSANIHVALGLPPESPLPVNCATQLLSRLTGLTNPYEVVDAVLRYANLTPDQRTDLYTPNNDADNAIVQATLDDLLASDQTPKPQLLHSEAAPVSKIILHPAMKSGITKIRRWLSAAASRYGPHTSDEGKMAHTIIGMHYLVTHLDHPVILDQYAWSPALGPNPTIWTSLTQAAANGGLFGAAKAMLVSAVTQETQRPDILDLATNEIYEIKPLTAMAEGLAQLADYLLLLNTAVYGGTAADTVARKLIEALTPTGIDPNAKWQTPNPELRPFLPGQWHPAQIYPLPDGRFMFVVRPVPGVIGYKILNNDEADADGPSHQELVSKLYSAMAALAVVAAATYAAPSTDIPTVGTYPSPVGRNPINIDTLTAAALITGAATLAVALATVAADLAKELGPMLGELAPLLLAFLL